MPPKSPTRKRPQAHLARRPVFRVLELGAGNAPVLHSLPTRYMGKRNIEYHGIDREYWPMSPFVGDVPANIKTTFHGADYHAFLTKGKRKLNYYDEIHFHMTCNELFENRAALKAMFKALKPGGLLFATEQQEATPTTGFMVQSNENREAHNAALATEIRKMGFEILRVHAAGKLLLEHPDTIPLGIQPEPGRKFPTRIPTQFLNKVSYNGYYARQFIVLRKPKNR